MRHKGIKPQDAQTKAASLKAASVAQSHKASRADSKPKPSWESQSLDAKAHSLIAKQIIQSVFNAAKQLPQSSPKK
jgi:hypothetical protein